VLQVLKEKRLFSKLSKCEFWSQEVSFFGHVILKGGSAVDPSKVDAVMQWESPKSVFEVRIFLGWQVTIRDLFKDSLSWRCH